MSPGRWIVGALAAVALVVSAARAQTPWNLASYDVSRSGARQRDLPGRLLEVSGLAATPEGRLFAHDDERARVYELDPASGDVLKRIDVGPGGVRGDFEGIAIAGERFFLVESDGTVYEFGEGDDKEDMAFAATPTGLGDRCEVEGLAYDPGTDALLMACKSTKGRQLRDHLVIFALPLATMELEEAPRFKVPYRSLAEVGAKGRLHPSGVEVHPVSGRIFVVAAREEGMVELSREGRFVGAVELPHSRHRQPEGLTFIDRTLLVADEGAGSKATLTTYRHRPRDPGAF